MHNFQLKVFSIFLYASVSLAVKEIAPLLPRKENPNVTFGLKINVF